MEVMFREPVVFVDIETTGGSYQKNRIIEIGAIRMEDGQVTQKLHSLVNPGMYLPEWISNLTGITEADLAPAPYFEDIAEEISRICEGAIFVAHNVRFDYSFIKNQMEGCGYDKFNHKLLCTVRLSRSLYPEHRKHKLQNLIERHDIKVSARHRAYDDARVLADFCQLAYSEKGDAAFTQAIAIQLKKRAMPPNLSIQAIDNLSNKPGVYIFEDEEGRPLYIGKSVNLRKRIMSHFQQDTRIEKEMKLSRGVHNISTIETDNELQALLLESKLVKEKLPLHNRQLRRIRKYVALMKGQSKEGYTTISIDSVDLADCEDISALYGVFETKNKAKNFLLEHQKTYSLCPKLLGLEKGNGRCFQSQLGRCSGACSGKIDAEKYNLQVELALERTKVASWPYNGPVLIKHKNDPSTGMVVDQWRISGEFDENGLSTDIDYSPGFFDFDTYKILRSYLLTKKDQLILTPLPA
jgi:DNA polymerase-3 subunit epsilon